MPKQVLFTLALLAAACWVPAFAQDVVKPDKIVLEEKTGSVMTSTGGDFQTADAGKLLADGESMMLNDGAKATVVYYYYYDDEGNRFRKCVEEYSGPDTFVIDDSCKAAAWITSNPRGTLLILGGAAVVAALLGGGGNDDDAPPISAGAR
jgi:hypothetical protein